jgi:hypothetical protein
MTAPQTVPVRRAIAWDTLAESRALAPAVRTVVGETWRERMRQEHLAVGAFALLTQEAAAVGCNPVVLELLARASADEVRHTEICRKMAVVLLGEAAVPRGWRGLPSVPRHPDKDPATRALLHVVEMCCLSETLTGVFFTEMRSRASHPAARAIVDSLLEDEIDHGKVGWAYLADRAQGQSARGVAEALPAMLERTFGHALAGLGRVQDDDASEAFGYIRDGARAAILRRALNDVVVPGFEAVGIDLSAARPMLATLLQET